MEAKHGIFYDIFLAVVVGLVAGVAAFLPGFLRAAQTPVVSCEARTTERRCLATGSDWEGEFGVELKGKYITL